LTLWTRNGTTTLRANWIDFREPSAHDSCGFYVIEMAACAISPFAEFPRRLLARMTELSQESGQDEFLMPVGLFLVVDKENGGDATAEELVSRFELLDFESRNVVDFYFLGWTQDPSGNLKFSLADFRRFRNFLMEKGIKQFGGNADLILVDAHYKESSVNLNFQQAIRIDLSTSVKEGDFFTLGAFLQSIIQAAEEVEVDRQGARDRGLVFSISDRLGLAIAKSSLLDFILEKWGKIIGARKLKQLTVQNLGPSISLQAFGPF
jgi:hypothetical protein